MSPCFPEVAAAPVEPPAAGELWLLAESSQLAEARRFTNSAAAAFGLSEEERYAFTFAANEAVSNAIEHGFPSPEGTIRLSLAEERGALVLYVEDHGAFAPSAPAAEVLPDRGRGLAFMAALVDEVDIRQGAAGTVVRLCKARTGGAAALADPLKIGTPVAPSAAAVVRPRAVSA